MFKLHSKTNSSATSSTTSFSSSSGNSGLGSSPGPRVGLLLLGTTYLDTIMHVNHFPSEDTKQRAERIEQRRGGNAANSAEVLGQDPRAKVWYMSSMPSQVASRVLLRALEESKVNTDACVFHGSHHTPPQAYIIQAGTTGTRTIISHSTLPDITFAEFAKKFDMECLKMNSDISKPACPYRWIHFEGRGLEVEKMIDHVEAVYVRQNWRQKLTISVEFEKGDRPGIASLLKKADVCFFSRLYAETLGFDRPEFFLSSVADFCKPTATLFCCWGSLGAVGLHLESGTRFSSSAGHVGTVVDTIGAGDTFIAGIILALGVRGYDIGRGLRFACELASQKCSQYGFRRLLQTIPPDL
ncbi:hypothetical protein BG005_011073 [Podila minutissima]|nr:hypothetical protein BG005_011073 [Podila minutissima]